MGLAVLLGVAALVGWQLTRNSPPAYRTSVVGTGTVVATLTSVGTITPIDQANLNFNVSGTVGAVDVSVGQTVAAGQTLASLDIADLNATVVSSQATLASATATLASAEASETATTSPSSTPTPNSTPASSSPAETTTSSTAPSSGRGQSTQNNPQITTLQATLVADQMQEDQDSFQAGATIKTATASCESEVSAASGSTAPAASGSTTPAASGSTTPAASSERPGFPTGPPNTTTTTSPGGTGPPLSCSTALGQASSAQAKVAADIKKVDQDESSLNAALGISTGTGGGSPTGPHPPGGTGGTTGGPTPPGGTGGTTGATTPAAGSSSGGPASSAVGTSTGGTSSGSTGTKPSASAPAGESTATPTKTATPQQLAVDQASIDTAQANLTDAQQALSGANLVSTITGTVASVSIGAGDSVTAGSTSQDAQMVVIGNGSSYDVTAEIPVANISEVAIGQQARITPDSTNSVLNGEVAAISVLASSGSTTTTYPVTISLQSTDLGQLSGADANVAIIVKKSVGVTTVASSAIRTLGSVHLVTVVDDNTVKEVRVSVGTVGSLLTQVTSGVSPGQVVSLANLNEPLPSTSSTATRFGGALGAGGLGGGGLGRVGGGGGGVARIGG